MASLNEKTYGGQVHLKGCAIKERKERRREKVEEKELGTKARYY